MQKTIYFAAAILLLSIQSLYAQKTDANVFGDVQSNGQHVSYITIAVKGTSIGTTTDDSGHYMLTNLPTGTHTLVAQGVGYKSQEKVVEIVKGKSIEQEKKMQIVSDKRLLRIKKNSYDLVIKQ